MNITKLTEPGSLRAWLQNADKVVALDIETTGLTKNDKIISAAVTGKTADDVAFFGPEMLHELSDASGTHFVYHNASFDIRHLRWAGVGEAISDSYSDTLILAHLLDENGSHSLGDLVKRYFNDDYKAEFWGKYKRAEDASESELANYNAKDVHFTRKLFTLISNALAAGGIPESLVQHVHLLQRSLLSTEISGIAVDVPYLMQKGMELKTRIESLLPKMRESVKDEIEIVECEDWCKEIYKRKTPAGRARVTRPEFSFDSAKQLQRLLYGQLALPQQVNEKTKSVSVDYDSLEKIKELHPVVAMIQDYREANKVYSTYINGTLDRMVDGRIYPSFNVCGTATGRLSHQNPNMANLPKNGGIRGMFIPDPGYVFVTADYASLEVYVEAHFTQDKNLLKLIETGMSKHDLTAAEVGISRDTAKTVNFLAQYHGTSFKLSKVLGISQQEAQKILDKYWDAYGGCKAFKAFTDMCVNTGNPIIYPTGRRRRFEKKPRREWDGDYRAAYNSPIQGTGSDCMSWAFYTCSDRLKELGWGRGGWTVHDEGIMMVKKEFAEEASKLLVDTMVEAGRHYSLNVTLKAEPCIMETRWED